MIVEELNPDEFKNWKKFKKEFTVKSAQEKRADELLRKANAGLDDSWREYD